MGPHTYKERRRFRSSLDSALAWPGSDNPHTEPGFEAPSARNQAPIIHTYKEPGFEAPLATRGCGNQAPNMPHSRRGPAREGTCKEPGFDLLVGGPPCRQSRIPFSRPSDNPNASSRAEPASPGVAGSSVEARAQEDALKPRPGPQRSIHTRSLDPIEALEMGLQQLHEGPPGIADSIASADQQLHHDEPGFEAPSARNAVSFQQPRHLNMATDTEPGFRPHRAVVTTGLLLSTKTMGLGADNPHRHPRHTSGS